MKLDYVIHGNSNHTGFGIHCRNMIKALTDRGKNIAVILLQDIRFQTMNKYIKQGLENVKYIKGDETSILIYHHDQILRFHGGKRYAFSIFETDRIPELELVYLKTLDKILTPSEWGKGVLINNDIEENKIKVLNEGFDGETFHVKHSYEFNIERAKRRGYYTFLHVGKFEERKSSAMIIQAFKQAVAETGIVANLLMKCENPFNPRWYEEFEIARGNADNIHIYGEGQKTDEQMAQIYHNADFGLYASKGEAWGLPILESIACGLPTITTSWTGQGEYLKGYPKELLITQGLKEIADDGLFFRGDKGNWIAPDRDELKAKIKYVLENAESVIRRKQEYADSVKAFTWENSIKGL